MLVLNISLKKFSNKKYLNSFYYSIIKAFKAKVTNAFVKVLNLPFCIA